MDKYITFRSTVVRNKVAHGEHSIPVDKDMIQEFTYTVIGAMHEVTNSIVNGFVNKTYLRKTMPTPNAVASAHQILENEAVTPSGFAEKINGNRRKK